MYLTRSLVCAAALAAASASAGLSFDLPDRYFGQDDTHRGISDVRDTIGSQFGISKLKTFVDATTKELKIEIFSDYFKRPGTPVGSTVDNYGFYYTTPGDLLISTNPLAQNVTAWNTLAGPGSFEEHTKKDLPANQEDWEFALHLEGLDFSGYATQADVPSSGAVSIYSVIDSKILTSTQWADYRTTGIEYRAGQEVSYNPAGQTALNAVAGSWLVDFSANKLVITVPIVSELIGGGFMKDGWALHWAATCANDVIEAYIAPQEIVIVPEPATVALAAMFVLGSLVAVRRRAR